MLRQVHQVGARPPGTAGWHPVPARKPGRGPHNIHSPEHTRSRTAPSLLVCNAHTPALPISQRPLHAPSPSAPTADQEGTKQNNPIPTQTYSTNRTWQTCGRGLETPHHHALPAAPSYFKKGPATLTGPEPPGRQPPPCCVLSTTLPNPPICDLRRGQGG